MTRDSLTYVSTFSGVGGFDQGFDAAGFRCEAQVEIDAKARSVLKRHWPGITQHADIREVGKRNLPSADVLIGGFPCQDLSVAGQRKGLQGGTRSGLFYELARLAVELRPRFVVFENVPGLLSSDDGRDFARVLRHLGDCGFHGGWRVLDAEGFGVAQHRRRVFGVFTRDRSRIGCVAEILALRESLRWHPAEGGKAGEEVAGTLGGGTAGRGWSDDLERAGAFVCQGTNVGPLGTIRAGGGNHTSGVPFIPQRVSPAVSAKWAKGSGGPSGDDRQNLIACVTGNRTHALTAEGRDASEDGTGRGTPIVAFTQNQRNELRELNVAGALAAEPGMKQQTYIARTLDRNGGLAPSQGGTVIQSGLSVRRLTPRECERLMGWPDVLEIQGATDDHIRGAIQGCCSQKSPAFRPGGPLFDLWRYGVGRETSSEHLGGAGSRDRCLSFVSRGYACQPWGLGAGAGSASTVFGVRFHVPAQAASSVESLFGPLLQSRDGTPFGKAAMGCVARLSGWTRWTHDGKEIADGPRYRMCGNGIVKWVAAFIANRLRKAVAA